MDTVASITALKRENGRLKDGLISRGETVHRKEDGYARGIYGVTMEWRTRGKTRPCT